MRKQLTIIAIQLVLLTSLSVAQENNMSFSLEEAQNFAEENSYLIKNAAADYQKSFWQTREVLSTGLPEISAGANYQNNFQIAKTVVPASTLALPGQPTPNPDEEIELQFGVPHNISADISARQLIVDGRYFIGLKANKAIISAAKGQVELTKIELRQVIASTYYSVLTARENKELVDSNINTLNQILYETQELYTAGFAEELDVDRLRLNLANLESRKKSADLQYELSQNVLKYQMGLTLDVNIELTDRLENLLVVSADLADRPFDYQKREEYSLLSTQVKLRGYEAASVRAGYFPSLYFNAGYGFANQRQTFSDLWQENWFPNGYYGFQLNVPIFDSYKKAAQTKQIKWEQEKLKNDLANFQAQAELEVKQARTAYKNALEEYRLQQQNLELAEKIYGKVNAMYGEGLGSSLELAQAESELNTTQINYINSIYNLLTKKVELDKALGEL